MPQVPTNPFSTIVKDRPHVPGAVDVIPTFISFETQHETEKIYVKARAHPIVNFGWVLNIAFLIVLPAFIFLLYWWIPFNFEITDYVPVYSIGVLTLVYYSVIFTNAFFNFLDWYYDLYLVTNERIINIQFDPLKTHRVTESRIEDIEHVEETVVGFFPSIFNFGDVKVSTAARRGLFVFRSIPKPAWFRDVITDISRYLKNT